MKKFATMLLALLLTAALTVPAMATFTPSSENKDAPEIISATFEDGTDCEVPAEQLTPGHGVHAKDPAACLRALEGHEFFYEYLEPTDKLGADVPFFIFGRTGFVEGIGEIITPLEIPPASYAVIWPGRGISTAEIFAAPNLTRDTKSLKIDILSGKALEIWPNLYGHNDLQNVAQELEHRVTEGLGMLACGTHDARMTGSGSAVFGVIADPCSYRLPQLPDGWKGFAAKSLREHPLSAWLD